MLATIDTPAALAARLASKRTRTVLLIVEDVLQETQVGFAWRDAVELLWTGEYDARPIRVIDFDDVRLTGSDETAAMAIELSRRTYAEGRTPPHLHALLDAHGLDCCDPDEEVPRRDANTEHRLGRAQLGLVR